jgi:hypothetical protein
LSNSRESLQASTDLEFPQRPRCSTAHDQKVNPTARKTRGYLDRAHGIGVDSALGLARLPESSCRNFDLLLFCMFIFFLDGFLLMKARTTPRSAKHAKTTSGARTFLFRQHRKKRYFSHNYS